MYLIQATIKYKTPLCTSKYGLIGLNGLPKRNGHLSSLTPGPPLQKSILTPGLPLNETPKIGLAGGGAGMADDADAMRIRAENQGLTEEINTEQWKMVETKIQYKECIYSCISSARGNAKAMAYLSTKEEESKLVKAKIEELKAKKAQFESQINMLIEDLKRKEGMYPHKKPRTEGSGPSMIDQNAKGLDV